MQLRLITASLSGALLALILAACGQDQTFPEATSPASVPVSQSPNPVTTKATLAASTASGLSESHTPESTDDRTPTSTPEYSSRASLSDSTYSRRTPFVPLDEPAFLTTSETDYLPEEDLVLGLEWMGEARAYPIRMLTYHHIVNDTVAGRPLLVTY